MVNTGGNEVVGGAGGFGFGGFGGGGLLEGIILASLLGRRGGGLFGGDDSGSADLNASGIAAKVVELQSSANILAAVESAKNATVLGTLAVSDAVKDGNYASAIQAERNTAQLSTQATAFAFAQERQNDQNTAAILATIAANKEQDLRDRIIALEIRGMDDRRRHEDQINVINTNTNTNAQFQAQAQIQTQRDFDNQRRFDALFGSFNQINRTQQDIVNLGTMTASGTQATNATNIK